MRFVNLLGAVGLGICLVMGSADLLAGSKSSGRVVIKTTLGGRANIYPNIGNRVTRTLDQATTLLDKDQYQQAADLLRRLLEKGSLTQFEISKTQQTLANYYRVLGNYQQAYDATQAALAANGLDNVEHLQTMFKGVQLLSLMDRFKEAAQDFDKYQSEAPIVSGSEYVMQATNYFYQQEFKAAVQYVDKAFATGDMPERNWYQFKATSLLQGGDFEAAVAYCSELMAKQPNNSQWVSMLVEAYASMEKYPEALVLMNEAKSRGLVNSQAEVSQLYQLYAKAGRFVDAVEVIDQGLAAGQLQADLRTLDAKGQFLYEAAQESKGKPEAKALLERAIDALNQAVAVDPGNGEAQFWLGQIAHFGQNDNRKAREYFVAAIGKNLKHAGLAWYYLGGVEDHLNNSTAAKTALQAALNYPESKELAQSYLKGLK